MGAVCGTICGPGIPQVDDSGDIPKVGAVELAQM